MCTHKQSLNLSQMSKRKFSVKDRGEKYQSNIYFDCFQLISYIQILIVLGLLKRKNKGKRDEKRKTKLREVFVSH